MQIFIGLDGGGTGCRAQAEFGDGRRGAVLTGGPANVFSDFDAAMHAISDLLARCIAQAGGGVVQPVIVLGLAGATESGAAEQVTARLPYQHVTVLGDIDIALMGAFPEGEGIVMAVGTGSVVARCYGGRVQRLGGHGLVLGDEGSGAWMGREALRRCLLAQDGLAEEGALTRHIRAQFGSVRAIISFAAQARPADFATLAPLVLAQAHCPVAGAILDAACAYLRRAIRQLQAGQPHVPVAATGGLGPALLARMVQCDSAGLRNVAASGTGLDGALWYARNRAAQEKMA
ncbi:MAG: BadF/BadG/BcrA/BcrD ATPase family protein [Roseinatronobacter sp.]